MQATMAQKVKLGKLEVEEGQEWDFGSLSFTEEEIIRFAKSHDPLWLHINPEAAAKGPWKGIIASGPMLFIEFHKHFWIPAFGATVIAGMGIHDWIYYKPHYPGHPIRGILSILNISPRDAGRNASIRWAYRFVDESDVIIQTAEFTVLHSTGGHTWI